MIKELPILYKKSSTGKLLEWQIGASVFVEDGQSVARYATLHGQSGGKKQLDEVKTVGKNIGRKNETSPYEQACLEAESRWKKQKDKGYVEDASLLSNQSAISYKPMLAHSWKDYSKKAVFPAFMQPKLDGTRCLAYKEGGEVMLMSRQGKRFTTLTHLQEQLADMPTQLAFDGEIYNPDIKFQEIISYLKRKQEGTSKLTLWTYDCIEEGPFSKRMQTLSKYLPRGNNLTQVNTYPIQDSGEVMVYHDKFKALGFEGGIFRNADGVYKSGHRSHDLLKVKLFDDDEFEIVGSKEGKGRDEGVICFSCKLPNGVLVDVPMDGDKEVLKQMWLDRDKYLGKMLTVQFFGYTDSNPPSLRFPRGKVLREYE